MYSIAPSFHIALEIEVAEPRIMRSRSLRTRYCDRSYLESPLHNSRSDLDIFYAIHFLSIWLLFIAAFYAIFNSISTARKQS